MTVSAVTHLNRRGDARALLEFYHSVFGGDLNIVTNQQMGNVQEASEADQVMWGQVMAENGFRVMAFDVPAARRWSSGDDPFFIALVGDETEQIAALWEKLADGATVLVPLAASEWAPLYGMLNDKFGITWVVNVAVDDSAA